MRVASDTSTREEKAGTAAAARRFLARLAPAVLVLAVAVFAILPVARTLPANGDESQYAWTAAHYGGLLARLDFTREAGDPQWRYPGWEPLTVWALTQPMGTRFTYAAPILLSGAETPSLPYDYSRFSEPQPAASVPPATLLLMRFVSIASAALGLALFALRWGWRAAAAGLVILVLPGVREELALARAEGQLLLGLALCALTYRTRWFPVACGVAAALKLTAVVLWPLLLLPASSGRWRRWPMLGPLAVTLVVWTLLEPPAWFLPPGAQLGLMLWDRVVEFSLQSAKYPQGVGQTVGLYLPPRYLLPLAYVGAVAWVWVA
ncbi:MAG: hypothetical protein ACYC7H_06395, partial [Chloroflexota bacterium]